MNRCIQKLVLRWLRWRYGGNVFALKPPPGWWPGPAPSRGRKALYCIKYQIWRLECVLFAKYGSPMRDLWEASFWPLSSRLDDGQRRVEIESAVSP